MIVQNAVICKKCHEFIVSKTRHDYVTCSCGTISVDGGQEYLRRVGNLNEFIERAFVLADDIYFACADAVSDAINNGKNDNGIANAVMRELRKSGRIIADNEISVIAQFDDEVMIAEADGTVNRYKKIRP